MLCPASSSPRRCAYSEDRPTFSPEKVDMSDRLVQQSWPAGALDGLSVRCVRRRFGVSAQGHERLPRGAEAGGQQLLVRLCERRDLLTRGQEGVAVLAKDVVPRGRRLLG